MSETRSPTPFTCSWPTTTLVLLCDGRVVCGCADPYGRRVLGDARAQSIGEIWRGATIERLRRELAGGGSAFCGDCPLKVPLKEAPPVSPDPAQVGPLPSRLYVEPTIACNLSCLQSCCAPETGIARTRQAAMLDFDLFASVIDEAGASLVRIDFFNYGESFLHRRAAEMCAYIKRRFPQVYLYTSTNGLALDEEKIRTLVRSGIDEVTFSIDGATRESYSTYRRRGNLDVALANLRTMVDEKRAAAADVPIINWRYILFRWNDSDEEMNRARGLAADIGVDRLTWEVTDHPEDAFSRRFAPGTADFAAIRHEVWDDNNLGNAIAGATPRAKIDVKTMLPGLPLLARAGQPINLAVRVSNLSARPFPARASYGRRLVRLGAQLARRDGTIINRDHARAWLPATLEPGSRIDVPIEIPAPASPGRYLLRFDLVSEGIDWFERCGSKVTVKSLLVK